MGKGKEPSWLDDAINYTWWAFKEAFEQKAYDKAQLLYSALEALKMANNDNLDVPDEKSDFESLINQAFDAISKIKNNC